MISHFRATRLVAALFTSSNIDFEESHGVEHFRLAFPELQAQPLRPKIPDGAPPEIPRFIFANDEKTRVIEVARTRVQLCQLHLHGGEPLVEASKKFLPFIHKAHSFFTEQGVKVTRLGYVVQIFLHLGQSANQRIVEYFFRRNFFGRAQQVQIHAHTRISLGEILANRWIRVHPLYTADPAHRDTGILVTIDLNSLAEQAYTFSTKEIQIFVEAATHHIEQQIEFLHPDELGD